jgi:regulator of sirC expression with transglutaminase-like and TPR domain
MKLSFALPTALEYFASLVQSDAGFPLLEAAIALAQDEYPDLDVAQALADVDQLAARLKRRLPSDAGPLQKLRLLNQFFFRDLGFAGNVNDFHDPDNSYLNVVLRTRRGIPVSLAVLWLELAQGLGLAARGIGFPGHFMLKVNLPNGQVVIDPLSGLSLSRESLLERLEPYRQEGDLIDGSLASLSPFLQTATPREIIARMLRNLKDIHSLERDWARLIAVQDRLVVLQPLAWAEYRDRGQAYAQQGQFRAALADLELYLAQVQGAQDRGAVAWQVSEMKRSIL